MSSIGVPIKNIAATYLIYGYGFLSKKNMSYECAIKMIYSQFYVDLFTQLGGTCVIIIHREKLLLLLHAMSTPFMKRGVIIFEIHDPKLDESILEVILWLKLSMELVGSAYDQINRLGASSSS